jgi:hypothetical protein
VRLCSGKSVVLRFGRCCWIKEEVRQHDMNRQEAFSKLAIPATSCLRQRRLLFCRRRTQSQNTTNKDMNRFRLSFNIATDDGVSFYAISTATIVSCDTHDSQSFVELISATSLTTSLTSEVTSPDPSWET